MAYLGSGMEEVEKTVATVNMVCDTMTGNGVLATMTIGASQEMPGHVNNVSIYFDGVAQRPTTDYTLSGKTVTFSTAPEASVNVVCLSYASEFLDVISDGTVYGAEILDGALTDAKIATGVSASKITGALPAIDGSAVTNFAPRAVTKSASDPVIATNPANGVGTVWANTTSGEMYVCTDATAGENVWVNIGGGSGDVWQFQGTIEGYIAGGNVVGGSAQNLIQKFLFSSNTTATNLGDLQVISYLSTGQSSSTHGYTSGGIPLTTRIEKFEFSTSNNATSHGNLQVNCHSTCGQSSRTHGYVSGGDAPFNDDIKKFAFASNVTSTNIGTLSTNTKAQAGLSGSDHGYTAGGGRPGSPFQQNDIERFAYASDGNASDIGTLITIRSSASGSTSSTDGFVHSGDTTGGQTATIEKFSLSSGTTSAAHGNGTGVRGGSTGSSSVTHGYACGGQTASNLTSIDKYGYSSNTTASDHGDLLLVGLIPSGHQF